ncbi:sorbosone dehydrogenase family protein [Nocardioides sp.]|uniref:PQQ-dependent sugar dehydrogenase n=1 Tax=Nocardioides sp. TaxID=35761 RepID=UPI00356A029F
MGSARPRRFSRSLSVALLASLATLTAGCSQGGNEIVVNVEEPPDYNPTGSPTGSPDSTSPSTGSSSPSAASDGQPQVLETIAEDLEVPWGLAFLPGGDAIVTERDSARVLRINGTAYGVTEVGTIGEAAPQGEGGLLGVAVSPDFANDKLLYFYLSSAKDNRIVTARLNGKTLSKTKPLLTGIPLGAIHDGGRMVFGPDGLLYVSTGETGDPELAQDTKSLAGKILRLTPDGEPAPGNPLGTEPWSFGHRNVQGLAFTDDEALWASEFGQSTFDELNRIEGGGNYGWPDFEGEGGAAEGFIDPQAVWGTDVASPSGLAFADGALWMAALRGNRLWKIPLDDNGDAEQPQAFFVGEYGRMRTVTTAPDGTLWLTTSNLDGRGNPVDGDDRILRIQP